MHSVEVGEQREYYKRTAEHYDEMHINPSDEHGKALAVFSGLAQLLGPVDSILDVGAGTGRGMKRLRACWTNARIVGVEPVDELRAVGYSGGIPDTELVAGDALDLQFEDDSFDYVIETGVLHHIRDPGKAVEEMARVARKGVMISDSNYLGQGSKVMRGIKYVSTAFGIWPLVIWAQTRGKMYKWSEGDGVYYSYSAFNAVPFFSEKFPNVYYFNTTPSPISNIKLGATHVMVLGIK